MGAPMTLQRFLLAGAIVPTFACGLEKLDVEDEGGADGVPPAVQERFTEYCALSGCHAAAVAPDLSAGASDSIIGRSSAAGTPYVEFGNLDSEILRRITLPSTDPLVMPPVNSARQPTDEDRAVIGGWIAGVPFDATDGGSATDTDDSMTTVASTTMDTTTTTTTGTTMPATTEDMDTGSEPTFGNVQTEIFEAKCAFSACHDGMSMDAMDNPILPNLSSSGTVYDNIVNIASTIGPDYIVPGEAANSYLFAKCDGTSGDLGEPMVRMMPPGGMLTPGELDLLRMWINNGAER